MVLPSISIRVRAFTLVELLIVLGLMAAMFAFGAVVSFDAYRASLTRSERDVVAGLLARARSDAMANTYQTSWGMCFISPNYIIFRGSSCTSGVSTNELTAAGPGVTITGLSAATPVVFTQLSGTTTATSIIVTDQGHSSTITINNEGAIQ